MASKNTTRENWRAVPGYEGMYEVSDQGRVRSLDRITPHGRFLTGKLTVAPGGVTEQTPGQTDRVAQALAKAQQANSQPVMCPECGYPPPDGRQMHYDCERLAGNREDSDQAVLA